MTIFLVVPISQPEKVLEALSALKTQNSIDYTSIPGQSEAYFVSFGGTSKELSDLLGISEGVTGTGVVAAVGSYFGRAPTNLWEWVSSRWEN